MATRQRKELINEAVWEVTKDIPRNDVEYAKLLVELSERALDYLDDIDEDEESQDVIWRAMDEGLIYNNDQWTILKRWCTPSQANFDEVWEMTQEDITQIVDMVLDKEKFELEEELLGH